MIEILCYDSTGSEDADDNDNFATEADTLLYSIYKVSFKKSLKPSHGVLQLLRKNFYSVLILKLLKPLFSVFHVFQALSNFGFS